MDSSAVRAQVTKRMPALIDELRALVAIPSVAFPGFPPEPVGRMAGAVVDLLHRSGSRDAGLLDIPGGYPAVCGTIPGPPGAPRVLLYAHYDVQPAPLDQGWDTDPWQPSTGEDGRIYGRGAADDKSGVIIHAGALQVLRGALPVGVTVLVEGEEETISHLEDFVEANPELFDCDAFVIADMGPQEVGRPALTTALRGEVSCTVTVSTLGHAVHSGEFGGAAPDALVALIRILATLHDDQGNTVVGGLAEFDWPGADLDEQAYRETAGVLDGVRLYGTGSLASRLWSKPSATVIGLDAPRVAEASNVLIPRATAKVSLRIAPNANADAELELLADHLRAAAPWGAHVEVTKLKAGWPFRVDMNGSAVHAAEEALALAFDRSVETIGSGGSIPLINTLQKVSPRADVILWGAEDTALSRIHSSNESVDPAEIERMIVAEVLMLQRLGGASAPTG